MSSITELITKQNSIKASISHMMQSFGQAASIANKNIRHTTILRKRYVISDNSLLLVTIRFQAKLYLGYRFQYV